MHKYTILNSKIIHIIIIQWYLSSFYFSGHGTQGNKGLGWCMIVYTCLYCVSMSGVRVEIRICYGMHMGSLCCGVCVRELRGVV